MLEVADVRKGAKADIPHVQRDVRFGTNSGHQFTAFVLAITLKRAHTDALDMQNRRPDGEGCCDLNLRSDQWPSTFRLKIPMRSCPTDFMPGLRRHQCGR